MLALDHWHFEVSSVCALSCPRCPRIEAPEDLLNRQLTLEFFQDRIGSHCVKNMRKITLCGNDGDPIYCRELLSILQWIKQQNPEINIAMVTNGSHRRTIWWQELASILDHHDEITWSIDGWDQDSNQQYRRGCDWSSLEHGFCAFAAANDQTYRVWAAIAFAFNEDRLLHMQDLARHWGMDLWQLTKSTKFHSHYPMIYAPGDTLQPRADLVAQGHRFQREVLSLTAKPRPGQHLQEIFWQRAQDLRKYTTNSALCMIGNKGVFVNSQGEFYPCCWTANRYPHNQGWQQRAQQQFNLWHRNIDEIMQDPFWQQDFLRFDSWECVNKCPSGKLEDRQHVTEW